MKEVKENYVKVVSATFLLVCFNRALAELGKCFLFHFKSSIYSRENQSLELGYSNFMTSSDASE